MRIELTLLPSLVCLFDSERWKTLLLHVVILCCGVAPKQTPASSYARVKMQCDTVDVLNLTKNNKHPVFQNFMGLFLSQQNDLHGFESLAVMLVGTNEGKSQVS